MTTSSSSANRKVWLGYLLVVLATAGWGTSGLFITFVRQRVEISALALAFWRDLTTFLCLFIGIAILKPAWLRVQRRDLGWLAALGAISIGSFHVLWNTTVQMNGVAVATVIQEAAPAFVAIAAWAVFREPLTRGKILAVLVTFVGCVLGITLLAASLTTLWEGWRMDRDERVDAPAGADLRRLLALVGLLAGYVLALPWLGQIIGSTVFCALLMRVLSDLGWTRILVYSLIISVALYGVFVFLLKVPMPRGMLVF